MAGEDRGPLIATFEDGTQIYRNGVLNSRGYFSLNIGIYSFGAEFNPNTGTWAANDTASFVTSIGNSSLKLTPALDGGSLEVTAPLPGIVDLGVVVTADGDVFPVVGAGVDVGILGVEGGFVLADDGTNLSMWNTITVQPSGHIITTEHLQGTPEYPHIKVQINTYDSNGNLINTGYNYIGNPEVAARMAAGDLTLRSDGRSPRSGSDAHCFLAGTPISMWDGSQKPIEKIKPGDWVVSYDKDGNLMPGRVSHSFQNRVQHVLDVHGLMVTPGHVTFCGEGKFANRHVPIIDILRSDGALVREDGSMVRAATNCAVGSPGDRLIWAVTGDKLPNGGIRVRDKGQIRLGTRAITPDGRDCSISDLVSEAGGWVTDDGLLQTGPDSRRMPFLWNFTKMLPKPEDYVLQRSQVRLHEIYEADEWEAMRPQMPTPHFG